MKKNLVNVLTTENEVMEDKKERRVLYTDLKKVTEKAWEKELSFDEESQEIRKVYKKHGFSTKEINQKIREREDAHMEFEIENRVAIFRNDKELVTFSIAEFKFLIEDYIEGINTLEELKKADEEMKGRAKGLFLDVLETCYISDLSRSYEARYHKKLAKEIYSEMHILNNDDALYVINELYKYREFNTGIKLI